MKKKRKIIKKLIKHGACIPKGVWQIVKPEKKKPFNWKSYFKSLKKMAFLNDYLLYNSNNEAPDNYHIWGAFAALASAVSLRVWTNQGYFTVYPNIYVCLVGKQGARKTTAKDQSYKMLRDALKDELPVSAESMSKEAITQFMAKPEQIRSFLHPKTGLPQEYHPFTIYSTELKNFLSINPITMIDFLTTIYDREFYDVITKNKGTDTIPHPCVNFLSCETPSWIKDRLKMNIISGGFSRRMVFVYELERKKRITFPTVNQELANAYKRCRDHLKRLWSLSGEFLWTPDAARWYDNWYQKLKMPEDPMMEGFYESKHVLLLKVSMLLACCDDDIKFELTRENLEKGLACIDAIETNMVKLSEGSGMNKLAEPGSKIMDAVIACGGYVPKAKLHQLTWRDLQGRDFEDVLKYYKETKQLFELESKPKQAGEIVRRLIATADGVKKLQIEGPDAK